MNAKTMSQVIKGLKDMILLESIDPIAREAALNILLTLIREEFDSFIVDGYKIPEQLYNKAISYMRTNKIMAIKEIRSGLRIGLKESKELVERMSFVEKIPMMKGYQNPAE